jgi:hypothetical protein
MQIELKSTGQILSEIFGCLGTYTDTYTVSQCIKMSLLLTIAYKHVEMT